MNQALYLLRPPSAWSAWAGSARAMSRQPAGAGHDGADRRLLPDGRLELRRFHQDTAALEQALRPWPAAGRPGRLARPTAPALQNAVRLRVEGERVGLPGPALTPYLAGLLVLLGMLGTFLGMVVTLKGTGAGAGEHHRPADHPRLAGRAGQGPGAGLRHLGGRRGRVGHARPDVGAVPARAAAGGAAARHAHRHHAARLLARPPARGARCAAAQQAAAAAGAGDSCSDDGAAGGTGAESNEHLLASQERFHRDAQARLPGAGRLGGPIAAAEPDAKARAWPAATLQPAVEATMSGITRETAALHGRMAEHRAAAARRPVRALRPRRPSPTLDGHWPPRAGSEALAQRLDGTRALGRLEQRRHAGGHAGAPHAALTQRSQQRSARSSAAAQRAGQRAGRQQAQPAARRAAAGGVDRSAGGDGRGAAARMAAGRRADRSPAGADLRDAGADRARIAGAGRGACAQHARRDRRAWCRPRPRRRAPRPR